MRLKMQVGVVGHGAEGILRIRCPRIPGHPHDLSIGGRRRYPQDTAVSSGCHRYPEDTVSPGHHWYPQDTAVSPGYRRYPQDTVSQDTAVSWGHRILRTPPRVLGHGVPRIPPPVLGISRYPQDAPRVPRVESNLEVSVSRLTLRGSRFS